MTKEEIDLLLKDLCERLPYGVKCKDTNINVIGTLSQIGLHYDMCVLDKDDGDSESCYISNCKPYLFPLSSMTEEQRRELFYLSGINIINGIFYTSSKFTCKETFSGINWLLKNYFDINGLIPMGLAIDATGLGIY